MEYITQPAQPKGVEMIAKYKVLIKTIFKIMVLLEILN